MIIGIIAIGIVSVLSISLLGACVFINGINSSFD